LPQSRKPGLVYVDDSVPGITRRRAGRGWCYRDHRESALPIARKSPGSMRWRCRQPIAMPGSARCPTAISWPPGSTRAGASNTAITLISAPARGGKFDGCATFGALLPKVRARVEAALAGRTLSEERCIACVVRLLDTGTIRVGNEAYARANASFGATTLRARHAEVRGQSLRLRFRAKSGVERDMRLTDRALARFVRKMQDLPGSTCSSTWTSGCACPVDSADVNAWLRAVTGAAFTAKHFRTWHASVLAFAELAHAPEDVPLKALLAHVSDRLGNTPRSRARAISTPPCSIWCQPGGLARRP
jgi:DNA topoisomerase-1